MTLTATTTLTKSESGYERSRLLALINANWTTQAISVAAQLHLAEWLCDGPRPLHELADNTSCHPPSLLRLLRALASLGVVAELDDGRFALTELGELLQPEVPGSLAAWAQFCGTSSWTGWGQLAECVRTGESVRKRHRGADGFDHLQEDHDAALLFHRAMVSLTASVAAAVVQSIDFSSAWRVVDVGGGFGELLAAVLGAHPQLRGVLFDLSHAVAGARARLAETGVADRCEVVAGSFFDSMPTGADIYLLKSVLHDWDDDRCADILGNCRSVMGPHARLLVIERILSDRITVSPHDQGIARSDLNMLIGTGGRERTQDQFRNLLRLAGLRHAGCVELSNGYSALEAVAA
ncbi:methyltransferase [Variovorax sp. GT1P44]|uniref:methyltransferase n=1 Tax=Variovorax sp. GT1P44 TaxID=3443742 RepID=UPI003F4600D5